MVDIKEFQDDAGCHFRAHVSFVHHSDQYGCFDTEQAAQQWAEMLRKRIHEADMFRVLRESGHF